MLFVAVILLAAGYTFTYAAVKGDGYKIGGTPVWRQPWLPFLAAFTRNPQLAADLSSPNKESFYQAEAAQAASGSSTSSSTANASPAFSQAPTGPVAVR